MPYNFVADSFHTGVTAEALRVKIDRFLAWGNSVCTYMSHILAISSQNTQLFCLPLESNNVSILAEWTLCPNMIMLLEPKTIAHLMCDSESKWLRNENGTNLYVSVHCYILGN